jgi:hypothetical protein
MGGESSTLWVLLFCDTATLEYLLTWFQCTALRHVLCVQCIQLSCCWCGNAVQLVLINGHCQHALATDVKIKSFVKKSAHACLHGLLGCYTSSEA